MDTACKECGALVAQPAVDREHQYYCPRCDAMLYRSGQEFHYIILMALSSIILFFPAILLPILTLNIAGMEQSTTLVEAVWSFFGDGYTFIAVLVLLSGIIIPFLMLTLILMILIPIHYGVSPRKVATLFNLYEHLTEWSMGEVYLISILVAIIKLQKMAMLIIGEGFFLFIAFLITMYITMVWFNPHDIWHQQKSDDD